MAASRYLEWKSSSKVLLDDYGDDDDGISDLYAENDDLEKLLDDPNYPVIELTQRRQRPNIRRIGKVRIILQMIEMYYSSPRLVRPCLNLMLDNIKRVLISELARGSQDKMGKK